jgi:amino acid adenylation domain-containing protein
MQRAPRHLTRDDLMSAARSAKDASAVNTLRPRHELDISGDLPLSYSQERLWFLEELGGLGSAYTMLLALRLHGPLRREALDAALQAVVGRHEALRTRIVPVAGLPCQRITPPDGFRLRHDDLSHLAPQERRDTAHARMRQEAEHRFDLAREPLFRAGLLYLSPDEHLLLLSMHHIVSDGWSLGVLVREIGALYAAQVQGRSPALPALPVQYADYALWQRGWLQGEVLERQLAYWRGQLAGAPEALDLPTDHPRPAMQSFRGGRLAVTLPRELSGALAALGRREGVTLSMVLLAGFQVLLGHWSGQRDVVVGSPSANRTRAALEGVVGFFVNLLVLRTDLSGDPRFSEVLERVREVALGAYAHQDLPFEKLVEAMQPARDLSRQPLCQTLLVLQTAPTAGVALPDLRLEMAGGENATAKFDLSLTLAETGDGLRGVLDYASDLFEEATMRRFLDQFERLLAGVVKDPQQRLSHLDLLGADERAQVVEEWNRTQSAYPFRACVHELFEAQAARQPDATALIMGEARLSYGELERRANGVAHHLRSLGVGPETIVGVHLERSFELVVALLAILKAGGAYLPLDPGYPRYRLDDMLADAGASILLTQQLLAGSLSLPGGAVVPLDTTEFTQEEETAPTGGGARPQNLAYVIYTSGSTGRPKGVMSTHAGAVNALAYLGAVHGLSEDDRVLQIPPVSFDASVRDIFGTLLSGASLVMVRQDYAKIPGELANEMERRAVTAILSITPTMLEALSEEIGRRGAIYSVRLILTAGEVLKAGLCREVRATLKRAQIVNQYGATEATMASTLFRVPAFGASTGLSIPGGRPIGNAQIYVLDPSGEPSPIGVPGEICIGGVGLARGYHGKAALTAERFVPNVFRHGERLYRTGDIGRWRASGDIEYLGRADRQVKVRGFRIEPAEIEQQLLSHDAVGAVAVVPQELLSGESGLVAYVVSASEVLPSSTALRAHLAARLPDYMVPAAYVTMSALPLTPNGKLDRRALPKLPNRPDTVDYVTPRNAVEDMIIDIWRDILKIDKIGVHDNFFDLGGHSLLATRVVVNTNDYLGINVPLRAIFDNPTVAGFAEPVERQISRKLEQLAST